MSTWSMFQPAGDGVLVNVRSAGICGSDLHMVRAGYELKSTLGHESPGHWRTVARSRWNRSRLRALRMWSGRVPVVPAERRDGVRPGPRRRHGAAVLVPRGAWCPCRTMSASPTLPGGTAGGGGPRYSHAGPGAGSRVAIIGAARWALPPRGVDAPCRPRWMSPPARGAKGCGGTPGRRPGSARRVRRGGGVRGQFPGRWPRPPACAAGIHCVARHLLGRRSLPAFESP